MATANEEKVRAALDKISSGKPLGSAKQQARVRAALLRHGINGSVAFTGPSSGGGLQRPVTLDELLKGINAARAAQPPAPNDSAWAKGLGIVGKVLNVIDMPRSYVASNISALAQGIEQGDASKIIAGGGAFIPGVSTIANAVDNFGGDPNAPKGFMDKLLFADKQQAKDFYAHTGTGEYLQRAINNRGWQGAPIDNAWVKRLIGLAGDIGLDPLTWAGGASKVAEGANLGVKAAEEALVQGGKALGEQGAKAALEQGVKVAAEQGGKTATILATEDASKQTLKDTAQQLAERGVKTKVRNQAGVQAFQRAALDEAALAAQAGDTAKQARMLGFVEKLQSGGTGALKNSEIAEFGGRRGIWVTGLSEPLGQNSKIIEAALRSRESLGHAAKSAVKIPFEHLLGGMFGNPAAKALLSYAQQKGIKWGIGQAIDAINLERTARHAASIEATNLGNEGHQVYSALNKLGIDNHQISKIVQDQQLFDQTVAAMPQAKDLLDRARGIYGRVADKMGQESGKVLNWGDTYSPHVLTQEAQDFLAKNPDVAKQIPGAAKFEKTRTIRSGQDNTNILAKQQSTSMYGMEVPRNLSDAQLVDWANARFQKMAGVNFNLFETDAVKVLDSHLPQYQQALHKSMWTQQMAQRGHLGQEMMNLAQTISDPAKFDEMAKGLAADLTKTVAQGANEAMAHKNFASEMERFLQATKGLAKEAGRPYDDMVREFHRLKDMLLSGDTRGAIAEAIKMRDKYALEARRGKDKLAQLAQKKVDFLNAEIARLESGRASAAFDLNAMMSPDVTSAIRDIQNGSGPFMDALKAVHETAAQRQANKAIRELPVSSMDRKGAADLSKQIWDQVGSVVSDALSARTINKGLGGDVKRLVRDPKVWASQVDRAQQEIRRAVEAAGFSFDGFTKNLDRVTVNDLKAKLREELLAQMHGKTAALVGDSAYRQRLMKGISGDTNKLLDPLNAVANEVAAYKRQLAEIPNPAKYEIRDLIKESPEAAAIYTDMMKNLTSASRLGLEIASGQTGRNALTAAEEQIKKVSELLHLKSWMDSDPGLTSANQKLQRDEARLAGEVANATRKSVLERQIQAGIAEQYAKKITDFMWAVDDNAKLPQWEKTKNLSGKGSEKAAKRFAGVMSARDRALVLQNENQLTDILKNAFADTVQKQGFDSLPPEVQNLFAPAREMLKGGKFKSAIDYYDKINNVLKGYLTAKPGFVFRNGFGGLFMNVVAGVSLKSHLDMIHWWFADWMRQHGRPGLWNRLSEWDKHVYNSVREIQSHAETMVGSMVSRKAERTAFSYVNPADTRNLYVSANAGFNQWMEDTVLRGAMIADTIKRDPQVVAQFNARNPVALHAATRAAQTRGTAMTTMFHFSYDKADKSVFENEVLSRLVPFYTYTKNVVPLLVNMMIQRPKYFAWVNSVARNIQLGVPQDAVLPEYIKESGAIRTPFTAGGNRIYWMQDLPFNQLIDMNNDPVNFAASAVTPLLKTWVELAQGQQFYKKIPLTSDMKPSQYQNVPVVSQLLSAAGLQQPGNDGKTQFMQDRWQYLLGQLAPPIYQAGNYSQATDQQQLKFPTRITSDLSGIRLRVNTPEDQANELARQNIKEREKKAQQTRNANRGYGQYPAGYKPKKKKKQ